MGNHTKPSLTDAADPTALVGHSFTVIDVRELIVTIDGSEDVEDGDTVGDIVSRVVDDYPPALWDLVSREIEACSLYEREDDCAA